MCSPLGGEHSSVHLDSGPQAGLRSVRRNGLSVARQERLNPEMTRIMATTNSMLKSNLLRVTNVFVHKAT